MQQNDVKVSAGSYTVRCHRLRRGACTVPLEEPWADGTTEATDCQSDNILYCIEQAGAGAAWSRRRCIGLGRDPSQHAELPRSGRALEAAAYFGTA